MRCKGPAGAYIFVGARSQDLTIERGALSPVDRGEEPGRIGRLVVERRGRSGKVAGIEAGGRCERERERRKSKEKRGRERDRTGRDQGWFRESEREGPAATTTGERDSGREKVGNDDSGTGSVHWGLYDRIIG